MSDTVLVMGDGEQRRYEVDYVPVVGELGGECARATRMPRTRFLRIVEGAAWAAVDDPDLRWRLLAAARKMERFPLGEWINYPRGCGCVVGEFLVRDLGVDRRDLAFGVRGEARVRRALADAGLTRAQVAQVAGFGADVDVALKAEVAQSSSGAQVVLIEEQAGEHGREEAKS